VIDKKVVTGDFRGVKRGMLVRLTETGGYSKRGDVALVLETVLIPRSVNMQEHYDPMLVVLNRGSSARWPIEFVEIIPDEMTDEQHQLR
jgi:hypothetical protein